MCDCLFLALYFPAKPALIALCVVGGVALLAIIIAIIACGVNKKKQGQTSFPNGKVLQV